MTWISKYIQDIQPEDVYWCMADIGQYFEKYNRDPNSKDWSDWPYMTGDAAVLAEDGYNRILGRADDVINIAGHRLGTKEIENASLRNENVSEAAVVEAKDDLKGFVPDLYVALKHDATGSETIIKNLSDTISEVIGKIARLKSI